MTRLIECIAWCDDVGIDYITSWLLSRENLARPKEELEPYFEILNELFEDLLIDDVVDLWKKFNFDKILKNNSEFDLVYKSRPLNYLPQNKDFKSKVKIRIVLLNKVSF